MRRTRWATDRGATLPILAVTLPVLILMTAFAVDLGRQRMDRRTMQARADVVSLDLLRLADGRTEHERIVMLASSESRPESADSGSGGIRDWLLSLLDLRAPNEDGNPELTRALKTVAASAVRERVRGTA